MAESQDWKPQVARIAELLDKLPDDLRDLVAAQVIGTMQGVVLAESVNQQKSA